MPRRLQGLIIIIIMPRRVMQRSASTCTNALSSWNCTAGTLLLPLRRAGTYATPPAAAVERAFHALLLPVVSAAAAAAAAEE
jgi:hypothetical protein